MKIALTIAGSDSGGGAGVQADIKTMMANGVFATSAITALTAQNTLGVRSIQEVTPSVLADQIDCVFEDLHPDAVKTGMVSSASLIEVIADRLTYHHAVNIVVDPVMVATSGARLITDGSALPLMDKLVPLATVVTPNIPEAEVLSGFAVKNEADMEQAARLIATRFGVAALVKGGHSISEANDVLCDKDGALRWFKGERIANPNTHGTGCTLSSAIAANLAKDLPLIEAIECAKCYLSGCLAAGLNLGQGRGPMNHAWQLQQLQGESDAGLS